MPHITPQDLIDGASEDKRATVEEALKTIRQVEKLGGTQFLYNLAQPFSDAGPLANEVTLTKSPNLIARKSSLTS